MLEYNLLTCFQSVECVTLWDGKLFRCGRAPALFELGISTDKSNYVEIRKSSDDSCTWNKIEEFLRAQYAECCMYCKMSNVIKKKIAAGIQLDRTSLNLKGKP